MPEMYALYTIFPIFITPMTLIYTCVYVYMHVCRYVPGGTVLYLDIYTAVRYITFRTDSQACLANSATLLNYTAIKQTSLREVSEHNIIKEHK